MKLSDKTKKILKVIIIVIFAVYIFSLCLKWSMTIKYNGAPDEYMKYDICKYIFINRGLPEGGDESIRNPIWGISYAFTPILSYMLSALFMKVTMLVTQNAELMVIAARLVSVLFITGYALICVKISEKLFKGIYKWLFVVFATLLPQLIFLGSYINNDSLALFSIAIIVYSWLRGIERNWDWKSCIILGVSLGICLLSYYNVYGYVLTSIFIYCISNYIKKIKFKDFFKKGMVIALITFALAGWWFIRNAILYDGDFIGLKTSSEHSEMYAQENYKPSNRATPANINVSLKYMLFDMKWLKMTLLSFVGVFGYMSIYMKMEIYRIYGTIAILAIVGILFGIILKLIIKIIKKEDEIKDEKESEILHKISEKEKILVNVIMVINIIIPIILSIYYSYYIDVQAQGRYIMGIIIPLMYFMTIGFKNIFDFMIRNNILKNILLVIFIILWSIMPIIVYFKYIILLV